MDSRSGKKLAKRYGEKYFVRESADEEWNLVTRQEHDMHQRRDGQGNKLRTIETQRQREKPGYIPILGFARLPANPVNDNRERNGRWEQDVDQSHRKRSRNGRSRSRDRRNLTSSQGSRGGSLEQSSTYNDRARRSSEATRRRRSHERSAYNSRHSEPRRDIDSYRPQRRRSRSRSPTISRRSPEPRQGIDSYRPQRRRSPERLAYNNRHSEPRRDSDNYRPLRRSRSRSPIISRRSSDTLEAQYRDRQSPERRSRDYDQSSSRTQGDRYTLTVRIQVHRTDTPETLRWKDVSHPRPEQIQPKPIHESNVSDADNLEPPSPD